MSRNTESVRLEELMRSTHSHRCVECGGSYRCAIEGCDGKDRNDTMCCDCGGVWDDSSM